MSLQLWIGLAALVLLVAFVVFCFRQGFRVKPDKNRRTEDWPNITQGGSGSH
jgi:hypothetical protein